MAAFGNPALGWPRDLGWLLKGRQVWGRVGPAANLPFSREIALLLTASPCSSCRGGIIFPLWELPLYM